MLLRKWTEVNAVTFAKKEIHLQLKHFFFGSSGNTCASETLEKIKLDAQHSTSVYKSRYEWGTARNIITSGAILWERAFT